MKGDLLKGLGLPFPTRPLKVQGGIVQENVITAKCSDFIVSACRTIFDNQKSAGIFSNVYLT